MEPLQPEDLEQIGGHRLLARLGAGGMGVVYLGRSPGGRAVAVKVVKAGFARDARYRARFRREVAAARTVTGAFTAPLLDADADAAVPWLVTEYLPGLSLREAVGAYGGLPPAAVRLLAAALAEALVDIHRAGLAHRDLKPENIMLTAGGPRVIDFGIARPDGATSITAPGALLGTPGFMSPEQASGGLAGSDSDIFALGAVLVFAATGREPFGDGDRAATLERVRRARTDLTGVTDRGLRALVASCLRREPGERPCAAALLERLGEPEASVQGTRWLPPPMAEAVDRRMTGAEPPPYAPTPGQVRPEGAPGPQAVAPGQTTADPTADPPAGPPPLPPGPPKPPGTLRDPSRRTLLLTVAAVAAVPVTAGVVLAVRGTGSGPGPGPSGKGRASVGPKPSSGPASPPSPAAPPEATSRWKTTVPANGQGYPDIYATGDVLLTANDTGTAVARALDARTGRQLWSRPIDFATQASKITVGDGAVFVIDERKNDTSTLRALDPASGATLWTYRVPLMNFVWGAAATGSMVCVTGGDAVTAFDAKSGKVIWRTTVEGQYATAGAGLVLVESTARGTNAITALSATTGRVRWTHKLADQPMDTVIGGDGFVFTHDAYGNLFALHSATGKAAWNKTVDTRSSYRRTGGGLLFADDVDGHIRALRASTGAEVWSRRMGQDTASPYGESTAIGLSGGTLWVGTTDSVVYALDAADGSVLWTYGADAMNEPGASADPAWGALAVGGLVVLGTRDGYLDAVSPPDGSRNGTPGGSRNGTPGATSGGVAPSVAPGGAPTVTPGGAPSVTPGGSPNGAPNAAA
ncbi:PQQ-binding-like beta-propeller repeat protein [Streptomyces sp. NPDC003300]|uniref:outer membrane protein assembly factor BamB family protein n=1 Tax=unclassified Streptomyces TaxID=2593676 RepID=UPI0033B7E0DF